MEQLSSQPRSAGTTVGSLTLPFDAKHDDAVELLLHEGNDV
ncbi:hypothetical protein AB3662_06895 [Sorangium cellulosum]